MRSQSDFLRFWGVFVLESVLGFSFEAPEVPFLVSPKIALYAHFNLFCLYLNDLDLWFFCYLSDDWKSIQTPQWRSLESIPHTSAAPPHFIVAQCSMLNKVNAHLAHTECNGTEWTVCSVLQCSIIRYVHCTVLCKSAQSGELSQASFAREGDHVVLGISNDGDLVHIATKLCVVAILMMMMICWWW